MRYLLIVLEAPHDSSSVACCRLAASRTCATWCSTHQKVSIEQGATLLCCLVDGRKRHAMAWHGMAASLAQCATVLCCRKHRVPHDWLHRLSWPTLHCGYRATTNAAVRQAVLQAAGAVVLPSKSDVAMSCALLLLLPGTAGVPLDELEYTMAVLNEYLTKVGCGCCIRALHVLWTHSSNKYCHESYGRAASQLHCWQAVRCTMMLPSTQGRQIT
jgi:hypothetical protein